MMNRLKHLILAVLLLGIGQAAFAQMKDANKYYNNLSYHNAIPLYKLALLRDTANTEALVKLGDCYRLTAQFADASDAYTKAIASGTVSPEVYLYCGEALMSTEKYDEAKAVITKYKSLKPTDDRAQLLLNGIENRSTFASESSATQLKKLGLNTGAGEFCPVYFNGGLVFTSNRPSLRWIGNQHGWTGKDFYTLYYAKGNGANFGMVEAFASELSNKYHNGPVSISPSGTEMYYTSNNVSDGKRVRDAEGITRLKIFMSKWENGQFIGGTSMPFNNDRYNTMHPAISYDAKTIYFTSDMPGGKGGTDIWKSTFDGNSWSKPENLGDRVNTSGNESFPYISKDGQLYFSSNGHEGLGGMDIFVVSMNGTGKAKNFGAPMNSSADDFGVYVNPDGMTGYFSSNREGAGDNDDIYYFKKTCVLTKVTVVDEKTGQPLANAEVRVIENGKERESLFTDETGSFERCLIAAGNYEFRGAKDLYRDNSTSVKGTDLMADTSGYAAKLPLKLTQVNLKGRVLTADDKTPLAKTKVVLKNVTNGTSLETMTDEDGNYAFSDMERECLYEVSVAFENCSESKEKTSTVGVRGDKEITVNITMFCKGAVIRVDNIYYDYNKSDIRPDAALELDKLVALMEKYPAMKIELGSHTDARGDDKYNMSLSDKRAKSAVAYIVSKGIDTKRIKAKGYGETVILNRCANDVECFEEEHAFNRRTEFKILSVK
jgi:outer membrane protein OmpA-like peptidoglycan-associated protein